MLRARSQASVTQKPLSSFSMKRTMPEFMSKSESSTFVSGMPDRHMAVFRAMVDVPTPALEGRNANTCSVVSMAGGLDSTTP